MCVVKEFITKEFSPAMQAGPNSAYRTIDEFRSFFIGKVLDITEYYDRTKFFGQLR
jgi:hypothetical protein